MEKQKFNVLNWDFNHDKLEYYDVLPYFRNRYKERLEREKKLKKSKSSNTNDEYFDKYFKVPVTFDEVKEFIESESQYQFWSRCEYEMILHGWPVQKNDYKLDVHEQIMMNIDVIAKLFFDEISK